MKKLKWFLVSLVLPLLASSQTCDIELVGYTPPATGTGLHTFVVNFTNAENCGCNEFTVADGNDCEESTSSHVNNNETITHLVFGLHYVDEITGEDYGENTDCTSTSFHPGWSYVVSQNQTGGWSTGSGSTYAINPPFSWDCMLDNPIEGYCWEVVIWQINLSQTADAEDFPIDGWSSGNSFNQTQMYPDINIDDNRITFCPDPIITDTVYVNVYDTIYVDNYVYDTLFVDNYIYDTTFVDVVSFDTIYVDNVIFDTTYVEVVVDNYIYVTDTITELIIEEIWIDCETGLPCGEEPPGIDCPSWSSIFIPNTFTPNNDGFNDLWEVVYDDNCWEDVEFIIFTRWGNEIYRGSDFWDGSVNGGNHYVADGVYVYTVTAKKVGQSNRIEKSGHISVLR